MDNLGGTGKNSMIDHVDVVISDYYTATYCHHSLVRATEKIACGFASYIKATQVNYKDRGVVILYDETKESYTLAETCAVVLGARGIYVNLFSESQPSVLLSYAIRYYGTAGGLKISGNKCGHADHYGVKFYNESGSRITDGETTELERYIKATSAKDVPPQQDIVILEKQNTLVWIYEEITNAYLDRLDDLSDKILFNEEVKHIPIAISSHYTRAAVLLQRALKRYQFDHVILLTDWNKDHVEPFSIVLVTNGEELFMYIKNSDNELELLSDELFAHVLGNYILSHSGKNLQHNARIVRTSNFKDENASALISNELKVVETPPGFRHISAKIREFDWTGETFLFGYDGEGGYLIDDFVREKDAIQSAVAACEMVYYYKDKHQTLLDVYESLPKHSQLHDL